MICFLYEGGFVLQLPTQNEPDRIPEFKPREKIFRVQKESQEWGDKLDIATVGDLNEKVTRGRYPGYFADPGSYAGRQRFRKSHLRLPQPETRSLL